MNKSIFKYLIPCLLLFGTIACQAQTSNVKLDLGLEDKKGFLEGGFTVLGARSDGFYVLRTKTKGAAIGRKGVGTKAEIFIDYYENNMVLKRSKQLSNMSFRLLNDVEGLVYEFALPGPDRDLYVFYSDFGKNGNELKRSRLDHKSFELVDETVVYSSGKEEIEDRRGSYNHIVSPDKSKIGAFSIVGSDDGEESKVLVQVFDQDFNPIWEMNSLSDEVRSGDGFDYKKLFWGIYPSMYKKQVTLALSNDGVLNILFKIYEEEEEKKGRKTKEERKAPRKYFHKLYSFSEASDEPVERIFSNEGRYVAELMITHSNENNLRMLGFFSEESDIALDGIMFYELDPKSLDSIIEEETKFDKNDKKALLVSIDPDTNKGGLRGKAVEAFEKRYKKKLDEGKVVRISDQNNMLGLYNHEDGSTTIASEWYDYSTRTVTSTNSTSTEDKYVFGDLKFINLSADGETNWIKNLQKYQKDSFPNNQSVATMFLDDEIYMIHNDFRDRALNVTRVNADGEAKTSIITELGGRGIMKKYVFTPSTVSYLRDNEFIGFCGRYFKKKMLKFRVE